MNLKNIFIMTSLLIVAAPVLSFAQYMPSENLNDTKFELEQEAIYGTAHEGRVLAVYGGKRVKFRFANGSTGIYDISLISKKVSNFKGFEAEEDALLNNTLPVKVLTVYENGHAKVRFANSSTAVYNIELLSKKVHEFEGIKTGVRALLLDRHEGTVMGVYKNGRVEFKFDNNSRGVYNARDILPQSL